jgi:hypothetical protein
MDAWKPTKVHLGAGTVSEFPEVPMFYFSEISDPASFDGLKVVGEVPEHMGPVTQSDLEKLALLLMWEGNCQN